MIPYITRIIAFADMVDDYSIGDGTNTLGVVLLLLLLGWLDLYDVLLGLPVIIMLARNRNIVIADPSSD